MFSTVKEIKAQDIDDIFAGKILGLKIEKFASPESCQRAGEFLLTHRESHGWRIGNANQVPTDTNYLLGVPRRMASNSPEYAIAYHRSQETFLRDLREAFGGETPLEKLLSELREQFEGALTIQPFEDRAGLPAVIRHMTPETLLGLDGVCHADSRPESKLLSMNLYLSTPDTGGELDLWDWPKTERHTTTSLYRMVTSGAFSTEYRDEIRKLLPEPVTMNVAPGDLVIFDTSRVHAIRSFIQGHRISIQSFIKKEAQFVIISS